MTTAAPAQKDVLEKVDDLGSPGTPVTTPEVAEGFDCTQRTIYNRLEALVGDGILETKKVGANSRVWWRPIAELTQRSETPQGREPVRSHPVFDSELVGVIVWGKDLTIRDANDAFLEMAGLEYQEALGTAWRDLTPEEFQPASERHIEQVEGTGSGIPYEKQYYHTDGSRWWGLFESRRLNDDEYLEFVIDITDRKHRKERQRCLAGLSDSLQPLSDSDEIMATAAEHLGAYLDVSQVGYTLAEDDEDSAVVVGEYGDGRMPNLEGYRFKLSDFSDQFQTALRSGETVFFKEYESDPRTSAGGSTEAESIGIEAGAMVPLQKDGQLVAWLYAAHPEPRPWSEDERQLCRDVLNRTWAAIERAWTEEELRESEERLDAFVTTTSDVVYRMSPDWSELYYLDGQEFIVDTEKPRETWLEEYIPPDEQSRVMAAIDEAIETKSTFELEHQVVQINGTRGWTHSRAVPMLSDDGEITEWFGTASDITKRKETEEALRKSEKRLETELEAVKRLHEVSTQSIQKDDEDVLYDAVLDTAVEMLDADFGGLQRLDPEADDLELLTHVGLTAEAANLWKRVGVESGSICSVALETGKRVVAPDVETCEFMSNPEDLKMCRRIGIRAVQTTPLVSRSGEMLGMLTIHWANPHEPSERDLHLLDVLARQVADLLQQRSAYEAVRESEAKYRTLFESIDEGFCTMEVLFDEDDKPVDYRFLETNPAFEELTGLVDAEGERLRDLEPDHEDHWFERYGRIALTGEPKRFTDEAKFLDDRWFDVYAFRIGEPEERMVAILFSDVTERKQREQLLKEQKELLELIATGAPLEECLSALCAAIPRLGSGVRACVMLADDERESFQRPIAPDLGPSWGEGLEDAPINDLMIGTCGEAVFRGDSVTCEDVTTDARWSEEWRALCVANDVLAGHSEPIRDGDGEPMGSLMLCFDEPRTPTEWEHRLTDFAIYIVGIAVERHRSRQALRQTNESLKRLNDASRELINAGTQEISNRAPALVQEVLDADYVALCRYDDRTGDLHEHIRHTSPEIDPQAIELSDEFSDQIWQTFIGDDMDVDNDLDGPECASSESSLRSRVLVPLGRHGVICVGSTRTGAFDERTVDFVSTVAATVETAWDRAAGEEELARRNKELTRLDRLNTLIREIDQALVAADTREEIDAAICERVANSDLYEFAWIGDHDSSTDVVEPRTWAGVDSGYLEDHTIAVEDTPTNRDPIARALHTGDLQVVADIATASDFAPWREATLERGARSLVCIPLAYDDAAYGVLTVYADHPQLDEDERNRDVLSELGNTIAHTINARETRATLQTDSVVELLLRFEDADTPLCRLARETGCTIDYQGVVPRSNGHADIFFIARDISPEDVQATAADLLAFTDLDCLTERGGGSLFRARVSDPPLAARISNEGCVVHSITIDADIATTVLDVPHTVAVREFLDQLRQWNLDFELRARKSRERPLKTRETFVNALEDRLTDRQRDVLQTAYLSGFFETPRVSTGQEVTELLEISQPTFSEHLRAAERSICDVVFDEVSNA
ncbi:GAF domain-containing protein [Halegenticoccus tardaugens]|uniref:GAF domain-containing protein n=1 Tax=Halegenticoccus tardaugens TaxID=2071624 RepID=UPI0013E943B3|nr:GAF domain-containing protein [Halegenticoccus tardaugens]